MKWMLIILGAAALIMTGCSTAQMSTARVGPSPAGGTVGPGRGQLEVFSALSPRLEGENPTWQQHSDYYVLDSHGRRVKHVMNAKGYYSTLPRLVTLPAGEYVVKARPSGALWINVPVVVKPNEITRVHLDGSWKPNAPAAEIVMAPEGYPIGWRAGH